MTNERPTFEPAPTEPAAASTRAVHGRRTPLWANALLLGALVVGVAGLAFAAGRASGPTVSTAGAVGDRNAVPGAANGLPGGDGRFPGAGPGTGLGDDDAFRGFGIEGTITAVSSDSMTVTTGDGRNVDVGLAADTSYHRQSGASAADLKPGGTVIVRLDFASLRGGGSSPTAGDVTIVP